MTYTIETINGLNVSGFSVRAANNPEGFAAIGKLWESTLNTGALANIKCAMSRDIIALYHNYEGDHTNPYTLTLGALTKDAEAQSADIDTITIPTQKYAVFAVEGQGPEAIYATWQTIWNTPLERLYSFDFERHVMGGVSKIFIAIK